MALTKVAPADAQREAPQPGRRFLSSPWVVLGSAAVMLLALGAVFLQHPTLSPPTRDPAWYTWRAELLAHARPSSIVREWGPFGMFSGGYRVTTPLLGAWLMGVAGVSRFTFSILVMVAMPTLSSLALAAFAYRHRRDPLLFLLTFFASAVLFLSIPYVGYMDNIMCLYILALTLPFMGPARTSWGARSALGLLMFLATVTHPTTTAIFVAVLAAGAGFHLLTSRFSFRKTLEADGPMLMAAATGVVIGLAVWKVGLWGVKAPFADAALPPPYSSSVFKSQLGDWVLSLKPLVTGPLIAIALGWIAITAVRSRKRDGGTPMDEYPRMSLLWLFPYLGVFGFIAGLTYPYYRFMNTTLAVLLLTGLGAWLVVRFLLHRNVVAGALVGLLILGGFGSILASGLTRWTSEAPSSRFMDPGTRVALASVDAYTHVDTANPIVFVINYRQDRKAWGWAKTYSNTARAGLTGNSALRSTIYFGDVQDFLAGRPSVGTDPVYTRVSRGFFHEEQRVLRAFDQPPVVFLVDRFNGGTSNLQVLRSSPTKLGPDVSVLSGPGLAAPSPAAVQAGVTAGRQTQAALTNPPGRFSNLGHILRVVVALVFLLVVPGLIAARWFQLEDPFSRIALVPGMSLGLTLAAGVVVEGVHQTPFGLANGIATTVLAILAALFVAFLARRREAGRAVVVPFVKRSLSLFSNRAFGFLMGAVFLAVLGDGIVQAALAKAIAFGGKAGFSLEEARSPRHILVLVLLTYLPYTFISPFMGVVIDRFDRRKLLVIANGFRAVVIALVGLALAGAGHLADPILIAALILTLASTRLVLAIKSAGIPVVLGERNLMQGNSISQAGTAVFQIFGAGFALVGTKVVSAGAVVVVGAVVYGVGALFAARTSNLAEGSRTTRFLQEARRILRGIREGLREVRKHPAAKLGLASFLSIRMLSSFVGLVFALEVRQVLGAGSNKTAVLIAGLAAAGGATLGFVAAQALKDRVPPARLIVGAFVVAGAGTVAFGGVTKILGLSVVAFAAALGYFLGKISADTIMQQALSDDYRGRGFSFFDIAYNLAWILPALVLWLLWAPGRVRLLQIGAGVLFLASAAVVAAWSKRISTDLEAGDSRQSASERPRS